MNCSMVLTSELRDPMGKRLGHTVWRQLLLFLTGFLTSSPCFLVSAPELYVLQPQQQDYSW